MKFAMNKMKKINSDKHTTTLRHPDGHEIRVAHAHLSPKMRGELAAMPMNASAKSMGAEQMPHLEGGGAVQYMPDGGEVLPQEQSLADVIKGVPPQQEMVSHDTRPQLPPDFSQRVEQEKVNLSINPLSMRLSPVSKVDPSQLENQAETNVAKQYLAQQAAQDQLAKQQYLQGLEKTKADNLVRQQAGLPLLNPPTPPQAVLASQMAVGSIPHAPSPVPVQAPKPQSPQDPFGTEAFTNSYMKGYNEQRAGIFGQAKAETERANQEAQALQQNVNQTQTLNDEFIKHKNDLQARRDALAQDAQNQHIDPNHFWNSKSTMGKISTAIGMILGGADTGRFVQSMIDRDVEAQKANTSNKFSLMNANREDLRNEVDATNMTKVMLMDQASQQLKLAAAKTTDPLAKSRALQAAGQLDMQAAPILSQTAMRRAVIGGSQNGSMDPAMAIKIIVPEGQQQHAYKELQDAMQLIKTKDNILSAFDQLAKLNTAGNRLSNPLQSRKQIEAIKASVIPGLSKETAGRYTEQDAKTIEHMFDTLGADEKTMRAQRSRIEHLIGEKMYFPQLRQINFNPDNYSRYGQSGMNQIQQFAPVRRGK